MTTCTYCHPHSPWLHLDIRRHAAHRKGAQKFAFQAEVSRLMDIIIHSLYSNKVGACGRGGGCHRGGIQGQGRENQYVDACQVCQVSKIFGWQAA